MDIFGALVFAWFTSALMALTVGFVKGRANEALTLGVWLGPVGLLLAVWRLPRHRAHFEEYPAAIPLRGAKRRERPEPAVEDSERPLRRAA